MADVSLSQGSERRRNPRKILSRPAVLGHPQRGREAAWFTDLSLDGAFMRSDWKDLPAFTAVEVTVTFGGEARAIREYRLPATVMRSTNDGFGIRFQRLDMESYSALLDLLYTG